MPAVATASLSSNWKKLQQTLKPKSSPKSDGATSGVKRKRSATEPEGRPKLASQDDLWNGIKKNKTEPTRAPRLEKRKSNGNMGLAVSKLPAAKTAEKKHNASPKVSSEAPASTRTSTSSTSSLVNQGLHPTHKPGKYLALDCEMVGSGPPPSEENVLARVSIVNFHGEQVYDSYVQPVPGVEVTDYRTFVSGIRPQHLKPDVARPFAEVQKHVANLLDGKILIGHALKNDMDVLLLSHPSRDIRDTARHAPFRKTSMGRAPALRKLAKEYLGMDIQGGEHSSVEDARATMMLFKLEKAAFEKDVAQKYGAAIRRENKIKAAEEMRQARREEIKEMKKLRREEDSDLENDDDSDEDEDDSENEDGTVKKSKKSKKKKKRKKRTKRA